MELSRRRLLAGASALGTTLLAGCGGGGSNGNGNGPEETTTEDEGVSLPGINEGETHEVEATDNAFDPIRISIDVDDTIEWTNTGSNDHDVVPAQFHDEAEDWTFESGTLEESESTTETFGTEGIYEYYCSIHGRETMCGAILVGDVELDASLPCEE